MASATPSASSATPRLMLVTPALAAAGDYPDILAEAVAAADIAAVIVRLAEAAERDQINLVKTLAAPAQGGGAALLIEGAIPDPVALAVRGGADGAHLGGTAAFRDTIGALKPDRIAGTGGLVTRHDAMVAAEAGADYVMFGEPDAAGGRVAFDAVLERVSWWAELFEIPCVGYAAAAEEIGPLAAAGADFIALDPALWVATPRAALAAVAGRLREPAA